MESIRIKIANEEFPLRTEEKLKTEQAAREVNRLIQDYRQHMPDLNLQKIAFLVALHLAEKNLVYTELFTENESTLKEFNSLLDNSLSYLNKGN